MKYKIIKYDKEYQSEWDNFVIGSDNGTIFNEMKFLGYHDNDKFIDNSSG